MKIDVACVIDDDEFYVFGVKRMMQIVDFCKTVMVFENGEDALKYLSPIVRDSKALPDVILLDINMPIMNGWEFLDEFTKIETEESKKITIYLVSSSIATEDLEKAKKYESVSNYIVKPITADLLKSIMIEMEHSLG